MCNLVSIDRKETVVDEIYRKMLPHIPKMSKDSLESILSRISSSKVLENDCFRDNLLDNG